jgi:hypothetical protein
MVDIKSDGERPFNLSSVETLEILRHSDEGLEKATLFIADLLDARDVLVKKENMAI